MNVAKGASREVMEDRQIGEHAIRDFEITYAVPKTHRGSWLLCIGLAGLCGDDHTRVLCALGASERAPLIMPRSEAWFLVWWEVL